MTTDMNPTADAIEKPMEEVVSSSSSLTLSSPSWTVVAGQRQGHKVVDVLLKSIYTVSSLPCQTLCTQFIMYMHSLQGQY
jgi:hypothetical protein